MVYLHLLILRFLILLIIFLTYNFAIAMENKPVISQFELNREPIKLEQQKEKILKFFDGDGILRFKSLNSIIF